MCFLPWSSGLNSHFGSKRTQGKFHLFSNIISLFRYTVVAKNLKHVHLKLSRVSVLPAVIKGLKSTGGGGDVPPLISLTFKLLSKSNLNRSHWMCLYFAMAYWFETATQLLLSYSERTNLGIRKDYREFSKN